MQTKKAMAQHFLKLAAKGNSREAFKLYAGEDFKHHNVYFKGDAETLMKAIEDDAKINPDKIFEIQRSLEDGDLVAVHSRFRQNPNDTDWAVMHIFRFENDKVVELWDFAQAAPAEMINENGMF
ncbi:MAG: nuclear transport factor 2 family protein [Lutibacter sp.]|nr:nuclear transport factor 2 family protein [Lutibacter sp.]